ncbi:hypothetical protein GOP47_0022619 [Adiantum capillus-veneris]|uniref:Choline kinase n=1 Tax=Adiantum capillus-veneris TaxID=13818 RepID=A0A9D4Z5P3_ADICA|nr:hypothetical protein GOP47_0022619 [Adiantum capillus-veneris]
MATELEGSESADLSALLSRSSSNSSSRREWLLGEAYIALHALADTWPDVPDAKNLVLKPLKGAMTNHVYECHWPQETVPLGSLRKVLVRIYGDGCDLFFRREDEICTFERMSQLGHGPRLLARFSNGRVEEFLNARTMKAIDLRDATISTRIATKLREFHNLDMQGPHEPKIWNRIQFWINKALEICPPAWHEEFQLELIKQELVQLQCRFSKFNGVVGFCHNDLQYGNIMMNETTGEVTIIDYEYSSFNPIAFDIANHFCEMTADYHTETPHKLDNSKYPDYKERCHFIEAYLTSSSAVITPLPRARELMEEVESYTLISHLHWGLWGILSATFSDIDFDYLEYSRQRFQSYFESKPSVLLKDGCITY